MRSIKLNTTIVDAAELMRRASEVSHQYCFIIIDTHHLQQVAALPNPTPSLGLQEKNRWIQIIIKNQTQFQLAPNGTFYDTGRYWDPPRECGQFAQMAFSACNGDWDPRGATGGTAFQVRLDDSHVYDIAVVRLFLDLPLRVRTYAFQGWTAPIAGSYKTSAVASSVAEDGYNAATPEGNILLSDNIYEGKDGSGDPVRFRLKFSAMPAEHIALIVIDEVRLSDGPVSHTHASSTSPYGLTLITRCRTPMELWRAPPSRPSMPNSTSTTSRSTSRASSRRA